MEYFYLVVISVVITDAYDQNNERHLNKCLKGGSPGLVVMRGDSFPKVVGSNPTTVYWMDIFAFICCKIVSFI